MTITEAVIAGLATIFSAVITLLLKEYFIRKKERYEKLGSRLKEAVHGKWKGSYEQMLEGSHRTIDLTIELKVTTHGTIVGKAKVPYKNELFEMNITGGFYSDSFLKMDYENSERAILQFGAFVFKLSDDSRKLTGCFVGYGQVSGAIISGNATLKKI